MDIEDLYKTRRERLQQYINDQYDGLKRQFCLTTGESESYVQRLLSEPSNPYHKRMGGVVARCIESKSGLPDGWLDIRPGESVAETIERLKLVASLSDNAPTPEPVPLITWDQLPALLENGVDKVERWLWCPIPHEARTFALDAQVGVIYGLQRHYRKGSFIFVDMDAQPEDDNRVVAISNGVIVLRTLQDHAGKPILVDLYDKHSPITSKFKIVGTVIGMWVAE